MIIYFTIANNKYKYPMNNEKVDVRKQQRDFLATCLTAGLLLV